MNKTYAKPIDTTIQSNDNEKDSRKGRIQTLFGSASAYIILIGGLIIVLSPLLWLIGTSLKPEFEFMRWPPTIFPKELKLNNYQQALTMAPFGRYFLNSVILASLYSVLNVTSSSLVGYAFARLQAPGKKILFRVLIATLMIPWAVLGIPQFIFFSKIGLVGSYWPWVIWGATGSAWHIFLFRQFFSAFPKEIEEAAEVDGAGRVRTFFQIFLPNSLPVIATSFIFSFQWVWGDWITPLLYLNDRLTTLSVVLAGTVYVDPQVNIIVTVTMAGVVMYALPLVIVFFLAQRYILQGVVTSGLKG